jgi:hypothetical protein
MTDKPMTVGVLRDSIMNIPDYTPIEVQAIYMRGDYIEWNKAPVEGCEYDGDKFSILIDRGDLDEENEDKENFTGDPMSFREIMRLTSSD